MTTNTTESLDEQIRSIMRSYYNNTFQYAMEQLQKGDVSSVLASAETKQQELDEPYLNQVTALIQQEVLRGRVEELAKLTQKVECLRPDCETDHSNLRRKYVQERLAELNTLLGGENE